MLPAWPEYMFLKIDKTDIQVSVVISRNLVNIHAEI